MCSTSHQDRTCMTSVCLYRLHIVQQQTSGQDFCAVCRSPSIYMNIPDLSFHQYNTNDCGISTTVCVQSAGGYASTNTVLFYISDSSMIQNLSVLGRSLQKVLLFNEIKKKSHLLTLNIWIFHSCPITSPPEKFGKVENLISEGPEFKAMPLHACN